MEMLEHIVVRGVNWLGDAIMTTPALLRLREAQPRARITLVTPEKLEPLWRHHPAVDSLLPFSKVDSLLSIASRIRKLSAQAALILPNSPRSALEMTLARVPVRIGIRSPWRSWLLTNTVNPRQSVGMRKRSEQEIKRLAESSDAHRQTYPASAHQTHHYLLLASQLGASTQQMAPRILIQDAEVKAAATQLGIEPLILSGKPILGLNPGAEYGPAKRWPIERFCETARAVQLATGCSWIIFGGPSDTAVAAQIAARIQDKATGIVLNLAGKTSLRELAAALRLCRALLTNDTGPMHLAAAVGTPVVVPFGSTSPELTGPGLPGDSIHTLIKSDVGCAPCFLRECPIDFRCMMQLDTNPFVRALIAIAAR